MRIINGLKYTIVDQFKVLAITIASVFAVFIGMSAIFSSSYSRFQPEIYPVFITLSFVLMLFMGLGYTPIYFRMLVQGGFTRKEIFIIQVITDIIILISGGVIVALSSLIFVPSNIYYGLQVFINGSVPMVIFIFILITMATRTLFNCVGLVINKFNNRFAGTAVGVGVYFLFGIISRIGNTRIISSFFENHGLIVSILYLIILLVIEYFIMKTHNSKPITK